MQLLAEILIVVGATLPGIATVALALLERRLLTALVWSSFSAGLGLLAIGSLMLRRWPARLIAETFVVIGAMLPGIATVILEVSLNRPSSVIVGISLAIGSGLAAVGILMLRRLRALPLK